MSIESYICFTENPAFALEKMSTESQICYTENPAFALENMSMERLICYTENLVVSPPDAIIRQVRLSVW